MSSASLNFGLTLSVLGICVKRTEAIRRRRSGALCNRDTVKFSVLLLRLLQQNMSVSVLDRPDVQVLLKEAASQV